MTATLAGLRVGTYVRLSDDRDEDATAVDRQERDTRQHVEREGGSVATVYRENDTSAFKKRRVQRTDPKGRTFHVYRVIRPVFQEMLADLRSGAIDAAVVYDIDRLARDSRDLEDAIEIVEHYQRPILGTTGGLDLLTDNGRAMARVLVAMANKSSADTARRVKRKHEDNAASGIPVGGTAPFGWQADKRTLDPEAAQLVREAAQRVLAGVPLAAIVTDWNARGGVFTSRGNAWTPKSLGLVLKNPRVCGLSARNVPGPDGQPVLTVVQKGGKPVHGVWEPILSLEEWEALCAALRPRRRRPGGNAHRYLLSGLLACGKCGAPMRGLPRGRTTAEGGEQGWRTFAYQCHSVSLGGCGGVSILGPPLDALISEALFQRYEHDRPRAVQLDSWDREEDLARVQAQIADATAAWKAGTLDSEGYFSLRRELTEDEKALKAARAASLAEQAAVAAAPEDLRADWMSYSLAQRRAALRSLLIAVEVLPLPEMVEVRDAAGAPVLGANGKPKLSRPRDATGRVLGMTLEERVRPVWRAAN